MIDYKNNPLYKEYIATLEFFKENGFTVKCHYNHFDFPTRKHNDEMLYDIYPTNPIEEKIWLYIKIGKLTQRMSLEIDPKYAEGIDISSFERTHIRDQDPKKRLFFSDLKQVENAFSEICSNISGSKNSNQKIFEILKPLSSCFPMLEFTNIDDTGKVDNRAVWIFENNKERFHNVLIEVWDKRKEKRVEIVIQKALLDKNDDEYIMHDAKVSTKNRSTLSYPFVSSNDLQNYVKRKLKSCNDNESKKGDNKMGFDKNIILYGPPGTGKTYNTICYAVAICDGKTFEDISSEAKENYDKLKARCDELKKDGRVEFTTFHQSYGYEEFIEGIRPVMDESEEVKSIEYEISNGIFKEFCEKAKSPITKEEKIDIGLNNSPTVWKVSLERTGNNPTRTECMEKGHIRIGYDSYGESITDETDFSFEGGKTVLNAFINKMKIGDIVLSCFSSTTIDAVGVVTGDYEWHDEYAGYKRVRNVNWVVKGINEDISIINGTNMTLSSVYKLNISVADVLGIIKKYHSDENYEIRNKEKFVFIIDEINRGNISKIFGELITLIEPSKRLGQSEEAGTILPYSKKSFGVPDNVYIIGTMNTADRSIATIDTALRRRFAFKEMLPDASVLNGIEIGGIYIKNMLDSMNKKISVLFDREHTIGHAYFIGLLKQENQNIKALGKIFKNNIIPLLQEYFYEDYEKIRLVLGDNRKQDESEQFIKAINNDYQSLFGEDLDIDVSYRYEINEDAFENEEAYKYI